MKAKIIDPVIRQRIYIDLFQRGGIGVLAYPVLLPLIFYSVNLYGEHQQLAFLLTALVLFLCGFRLVQMRLAERMYARYRKVWVGLYSAGTCIFSAILGTFFVLSTYHPDYSTSYNLVILTCAGIASGSITSLAPLPVLAAAQNIISLLPPAIMSFYLPEYRLIGVAILVYLSYNLAMSLKVYKEYLRAFDMEQSLADKTKRLQVLSQTDPLTGLYNRGHFQTLLKQAWSGARRSEQRVNLVMMDIDHFKSINDNYGHTGGDVCLKEIAQLMKKQLRRESDLYCRYGGEEFLILLMDESVTSVTHIVEDMRALIEQTVIKHQSTIMQVTASFGLASAIPSTSEKAIDLINQADAALYNAKKNGRNRVEVYQSQLEKQA